MKKKKYDSNLPRQMYAFFAGFGEGGVPSFAKFAMSIGVTVEQLEGYRSNKQFDRAWRECNEIRRDYLIDRALTRRYDPSFVKFLLQDSDGGEDDGRLDVTVRVI